MRLSLATAYAISAFAHVAMLAGLSYFAADDYAGGLLPVSGGGGLDIEFLPTGLPGGGSQATIHLELPMEDRPTLGDVRAEEVETSVVATSAPLAREESKAEPVATVTPVSIDEPTAPEATPSEDSHRTTSNHLPEIDSSSPSHALPTRRIAPPGSLAGIEAAPASADHFERIEADGGAGVGVGNAAGGGNSGGGGAAGGQVDSLPQKGPFNLPPGYPVDALLARVEGRVVLRASVGSDGLVEELAVDRSSGWPSLDEAALEAVRRWRFLPARRSGIAVAFEVLVPVRFSIRDR